ncbi:MAG: carboxypeptidase regulatory-like domain-containing protein [Armatimonadetes bacterium]|nr:carboxypeptidase regulatory-like domain-containing protein [Armatimonadota bacterium]
MTRRHSALLVLGVVLSVLAGGCGSGSPKIGTVAGRVLDDLGAPVAGVHLLVGASAGDTNALGEFSIAGVSTGAHSVSATKTGYTFSSAAVTVTGGGTVIATLTGTRANDAPQLTAQAAPATVTFVGGTSTLTVTAADANSDTLAVTLTGPDGAVELTSLGSGQYRATVLLPANNSVTARTYNYQFAANDGRTTTRSTVTVTVNGLATPGDVGGGSTPGGGGPDIPNIR